MTGNEALLTFALIAGGFLLGGVMFSRALPKLLTGKDVCALRADKNPGAANVFAVCGVPMGLLCLALDMLKAYLPVSLAAQYLDTQSVWFALALTGVSLTGLLLLAGLYIFFSVAVKIRPHRLRSILVFALYGVSAAVFYSLHGEGALALGCGMIAVTGVLRHTRRFCVLEDEKPRISNSEF